ncbi:MAG: hypothetical protein PHO57_11395 [Acidithiobacillus sp.]|nr:hypothetical protein [Acidithiobacillus sp.]
MSQNKRLSLSILLALPCLAAPLLAQAALPTNTLPGNGSVASGQVSASISVATMNNIGQVSTLTLNVNSSRAIINWGSTGGVLNPVSGAGGFDVGRNALVVLQEAAGQSSTASVLNIDVSGQPSQIQGSVTGNNVNVYIANENGIFVGSSITEDIGTGISAPTVALMADTSSTAEAIFNGGSFSSNSGVANGTLSIGPAADIQASNLILSGNSAVNLTANSITANTLTLHGEADITGMGSLIANTVNVIGGFYGDGFIATNNLNIDLTGYVNNDHSGQILANGFQLFAGSNIMTTNSTINISLTANGAQAQGFNVAISEGNAIINSGNSDVSVNSPNKNSRLIIEDSGNLTVNPGSQSNPYGSGPAFQFPGLLYLEGSDNVQINADLVNAYSASAPAGYGVFVIGQNITDSHAIFANGTRGINFEGFWNGTEYFPAQSINGQNPDDPSFSFSVPIFFANEGNNSLSFSADQMIQNPVMGYSQPADLFLGLLIPNSNASTDNIIPAGPDGELSASQVQYIVSQKPNTPIE